MRLVANEVDFGFGGLGGFGSWDNVGSKGFGLLHKDVYQSLLLGLGWNHGEVLGFNSGCRSLDENDFIVLLGFWEGGPGSGLGFVRDLWRGYVN